MNGVFIIPTGIGCEIGGHAGDATPAAKLIASVCDRLIVNPNAVNASDINEMPDNCMYVEGSTIDRLLRGGLGLSHGKGVNKVLVVTNAPLKTEVVNSVNAARATIGLHAEILVLDQKTPLTMTATKSPDGGAYGVVDGWQQLCNQVNKYDFDALAITTQIDCPKEVAMHYHENGGVNPWGAVEAIASKLISQVLNKPVAHSPVESDWIIEEGYIPPITDPRMSAEMVSVSYLHCILKGLWRAPRLIMPRLTLETECTYYQGMRYDEIDFMVSPYCWGDPHNACVDKNIPVIMVSENRTIFSSDVMPIPKEAKVIWVSDYIQAVGIIQAMKEGISLESLQRPLKGVKIHDTNRNSAPR